MPPPPRLDEHLLPAKRSTNDIEGSNKALFDSSSMAPGTTRTDSSSEIDCSSNSIDDDVAVIGGMSPNFPSMYNPNTNNIGVYGLAVLTCLQMTVMYGLEDAVAGFGGLIVSLLFLVALPLLWLFPICTITQEMALALPCGAHLGAVHWVEEVFGNHIGGFDAILNVIAGIADVAANNALVFQYITYGSTDFSGYEAYFAKIGVVAVTGLVVSMGIRTVLSVEASNFFISQSPFIILIVVSIFKFSWHNLLQLPGDGDGGHAKLGDISTSIQMIFFAATYMQRQSVYLPDIDGEPQRTLSIGVWRASTYCCLYMAFAFAMITGASEKPFNDWDSGCFKSVASDVVGPWLGWYIVVGSIISYMGTMIGGTNATAFEIAGVSERHWLPDYFSTGSSRHNAPKMAVLLITLVAMFAQLLNYQVLVALDNSLYCLITFLELSAFAAFRIKNPEHVRPYKVPIVGHMKGWWPCLMVVTPFALMWLVLVTSEPLALICLSGAVFLGCIFIVSSKWYEKRREDQRLNLGDDDDQATIADADVDGEPGIRVLRARSPAMGDARLSGGATGDYL